VIGRRLTIQSPYDAGGHLWWVARDGHLFAA
jgi:hypothetical protein